MSKKNTSREIILRQATILFAQKGYDKTTIREICKAADTYPVSVNYYFGSKDNLFIEAFTYAHSLSGVPELLESSDYNNPEEKLMQIIRLSVETLYSEEENGWFFKIISRSEGVLHKEPFYDEFQKFKEFHQKCMKSIFQDIFHDEIPEIILNYAYFNFISQLIVINLHQNKTEKKSIIESSDEKQVENLSKMICCFLLTGIRELMEKNTEAGEN